MEVVNRTALERSFLRKANSLSAAHRRELLALMGNPPDVRNVPGAFWAKVEREQRDFLLVLLFKIFGDNAAAHSFGSVSDIEIAKRAQGYAAQRAQFVSRGYVSHSLARMTDLQRGFMDPRTGKPTWSKSAVEDLVRGNVFGQPRNEALIATEFTDASVRGGNRSWALSA